ncbi:MAG: signal peptidase I [Halodesulfurarchaeum sp.]
MTVSWTSGRSRTRRIASVLGTLLLVALLVPFLVYAFPAAIGAEGSYVVLSGSMEPAIGVGDVVVVYATDPAGIERGDVITFTTASSRVPVTHRVTAVIEPIDGDRGVAFTTMGDANEDGDFAPVPDSAVLGVVPSVTLPHVGEVLFRFPYMGHVVTFVNTELGFVLLVALPLAAFILNEIWTATRAQSEDPDRTDDVGARTPTTPTPADDSTRPAIDDRPPVADGVALDRTDLKATLAVLAAGSVYSVWVAYSVLAPWSVAVAVATVGTTLYLSALRAYGRSPERTNDTRNPTPSRTDGGMIAAVAPEFGDSGFTAAGDRREREGGDEK